MRRQKPDAVDQLKYEDAVLPRLLGAINDDRRDRLQHGKAVKVFVERLAVREAAREMVGEALMPFDELAAVSACFRATTPEHRLALDRLEEMTRGVAAIKVNQGQNVDDVIAEVAPFLLAEIEADLTTLIPRIEGGLDAETRESVLPGAYRVLRHSLLHPGPHERRWYERVGPLVWALAVYDYLRNLPVRGIKLRLRVVIPEEGEKTSIAENLVNKNRKL